ncbi:hypothetical protein ATE84_0899 [Aquimarina sp. MAR_2010_214]|uniref:hypothetical protein n=1 Tax=Aquimarina sp. MAR_2010_214 TaxID=1250026 RepID=UPI000C70A025|nr:hypothetical protein [Aquimarina sp. MAR_2010_214]PKV48883.1 hypothetical protein ATE84_0899 [Aquimarina sp. MAR_2010_214]
MKIFNFLKGKIKLGSKSEKDSIEILYNYLNQKLQNSLDYEDLYNLYYSLFCTLDILPKNLQSLKLTKEVLALTFVKLVSKKNIVQPSIENNSQLTYFNDVTDKNHWIEQIKICMIADKWPNTERARILLETN